MSCVRMRCACGVPMQYPWRKMKMYFTGLRAATQSAQQLRGQAVARLERAEQNRTRNQLHAAFRCVCVCVYVCLCVCVLPVFVCVHHEHMTSPAHTHSLCKQYVLYLHRLCGTGSDTVY